MNFQSSLWISERKKTPTLEKFHLLEFFQWSSFYRKWKIYVDSFFRMIKTGTQWSLKKGRNACCFFQPSVFLSKLLEFKGIMRKRENLSIDPMDKKLKFKVWTSTSVLVFVCLCAFSSWWNIIKFDKIEAWNTKWKYCNKLNK